MRKSMMNTLFLGAMVVVVLVTLIYAGDYLGLPAGADVDFAIFLPGLVFLLIGTAVIIGVRGIFLFPGMSMIGIGFAILFETMYDEGYITSQMMSGLTIGQIQIWCIIILGLGGGIMAAYSIRR